MIIVNVISLLYILRFIVKHINVLIKSYSNLEYTYKNNSLVTCV